MKKTFLSLLAAAAFLFTACEPKNEPQGGIEIPTLDPATENYERTLMLEQFTGQGCGYCPTGASIIEEGLEGIEDRVIWTAHHAGFAADDFTISNSESLVKTFGVSSAPAMMLNRENTTFTCVNPDGSIEDKTQLVHTPSSFTDPASTFKAKLEKEGEATVHIQTNLDGQKLTVAVYGAVKEQQDIRITAYIQENKLIGEQSDYATNQIIKNYEHNHVPRVFMSATLGDAVTPEGKLYQKTYTVELDSKWNIDNCEVVAFVTKKTGYKPVLNAASAPVQSAQ